MIRVIQLALLFLSINSPASAQYQLDWFTMDGGGALFTSGGSFELSGTIGQPDAGDLQQPMSGGPFELIGGFWAIAVGCTCIGDVDGNCSVDISDLSILLSAFGCCSPNPCYNAIADLDQNGCVELTDLSLLLSRFGIGC